MTEDGEEDRVEGSAAVQLSTLFATRVSIAQPIP